MIWVLLDVAIALLAVAVLVGVGWSLFRHAKTLMQTMSATSDALGTATSDLNTAQVRPAARR